MLSLILMSPRGKGRALSVFGLLFVLGTARADTPVIAGSLPEDYLPELKVIIGAALRQSPQIIAKEIEIEQAKAGLMGALSRRLPGVGGNLNLASNATATTSNLSTRTRDSGLFYNLAVSQPIFFWGALKHEGDRARLGVLLSERGYAEAYRVLAVALRGAYLQLMARKATLVHARLARDQLVAELALAKEKLASGAFAPSEIAARQLSLDDTDLAIARIEIEFAAGRRTFVRLSGIADLSEASLPNELPKPTFPSAAASALLAAFVRDGGRQTFEARVNEMKVQEADLNYRIARVGLLPKFSASAAYSLENSTFASANSITQQGITRQTIAVGAQWAIFDGFATRGAKLGALATKRLAERQLDMSASGALEAAQTLYQQIELEVRAMDMSDLRYGLAASQVGRLEQEFKLGNVAQAALDSAQVGLKQSHAQSINARAVFLSRWSEFVSLAGADPVLTQLTSRHDREKR